MIVEDFKKTKNATEKFRSMLEVIQDRTEVERSNQWYAG